MKRMTAFSSLLTALVLFTCLSCAADMNESFSISDNLTTSSGDRYVVYLGETTRSTYNSVMSTYLYSGSYAFNTTLSTSEAVQFKETFECSKSKRTFPELQGYLPELPASVIRLLLDSDNAYIAWVPSGSYTVYLLLKLQS